MTAKDVKLQIEIFHELDSQEPVITESIQRVADAFKEESKLEEEHVWIIDPTTMVKQEIAKGDAGHVTCNVSELISKASDIFVILHNHPRDWKYPTPTDDRFTEDINKAAKKAGKILFDHIIIMPAGFVSYRSYDRMPK